MVIYIEYNSSWCCNNLVNRVKMKEDELYKVLFHYNSYRKVWCCFPSGKKREYFNGEIKKEQGEGINIVEAFDDWYNKNELQK